jgi:molecular chaperone Hsp33
MAQPNIDIPVRAPAQTSVDDSVLPFEVGALDLRGRVVRLGASVDEILSGHNYPEPVAKLLGEAVVLTVMLGSAIKDARLILQTQTDGPVRMLVVDYRQPGSIRACARFDAARVKSMIEAGQASTGALLGKGHLAMTIDHGSDRNRYQGLVAIQGGSLEDAAHEYFKSSEQIPTRVKLVVAEEYSAGRQHRWRAGGILAQFLPKATHRAQTDLHPGDAPKGMVLPQAKEDDAWIEGRSLVDTVEDIELIDPELSGERLLYRLFHERGVRVFSHTAVAAQCSCSRDSVEAMLRNFSQDDRDHMVENGKISVTCEFCSAHYEFAPEDVRTEEPGQEPGLVSRNENSAS